MTTTGIPKPGHLAALTSMRFYAALVVVLVHAAAIFPVLPVVERAASLGYVGVGFFFTLSGFVLMWSRREDDRPRWFYGRRFARVWPAHAFMTLAIVPVLLFEGRTPPWAALPLVLAFVHVWMPPAEWHYAFNGPSWSLGAEAFFYLLFPVLARVTIASRRAPLLLASAAAALLLSGAAMVTALFPDAFWGFLLYLNPVYRLGEFVLGMCLAALIRQGWLPRWRLSYAVAAAVVSYVAIVLFAPVDSEGAVPRVLADLGMLPAFLALLAAGAGSDLRGRTRWLARGWPVRLGEWSYSLYLVHMAVLLCAATLFADSGLSELRWTWALIPLLVLAIGASGLLYTLVERPAERRIRARLMARPTRGAARPTAVRAG
jgi:peptidoglycan/LPS O-acetylase OafA/YrhL